MLPGYRLSAWSFLSMGIGGSCCFLSQAVLCPSSSTKAFFCYAVLSRQQPQQCSRLKGNRTNVYRVMWPDKQIERNQSSVTWRWVKEAGAVVGEWGICTWTWLSSCVRRQPFGKSIKLLSLIPFAQIISRASMVNLIREPASHSKESQNNFPLMRLSDIEHASLSVGCTHQVVVRSFCLFFLNSIWNNK